MRKTHRRSVVVPKRRYRTNADITAPELRVLTEDGHLGILTLEQALAAAKEAEMDLVEIEPTGTPPVAKITDFGRFQYQKEKDLQKQKAKQKKTEVKGLRLSLRIGAHDLEVRMDQAKKFLEANDKVKLEMVLRGRERQHTDLARKILEQFIISLKEAGFPVSLDENISMQGGRMSAIVGVKK